MDATLLPATPAPPRPARAHLLPLAAVTALSLAAYANAYRAPFTFDDVQNVVEAPAIHLVQLDAASLARAASGFPANRWLAKVSLALNYWAGGADPRGYHAVNVLFHAAAAWLVYFLALEVLAALRKSRGGARAAATVAALLFAVHPVQTQAVTYVVQRMTSMGAFFAFAALLLYLGARAAAGRRRAALGGAALVAAYAAFACKETFVVLPALALLLEAFLFPGLGDRVRRNAAAVGAAGVALLAAAAALLRVYWPTITSEHARFGIPIAERLLSQGRILAHYASLLVLPLPSRLHVDYDWPPSRGLLDPPSTLPALLAVAAVLATAVALRRRAPVFAFAVLWFLVALAMEQTLLPIDLVFEHRLYLASFGPFVLAAALLDGLAAGDAQRRWAVTAPIVAALAWGTHVRNEDWNDPLRLYADSGGSRTEARTLLTLADGQLRAGRLEEAQATLEKALALQPSAAVFVNLGMVASARGDAAGAERWYRQSIATRPSAEAWYDLGCLLRDTGRVEEAERAFAAAIEVDPRYVRAHLNLATLAARRGDVAAARARLDDAIGIDPGYALARQNRALLAAAQGRLPEALDDATAATALAPESADAHAIAGDVFRLAGRVQEAARAYARALELDPANARAAAGRQALGVVDDRH